MRGGIERHDAGEVLMMGKVRYVMIGELGKGERSKRRGLKMERKTYLN